MQMAVKFNVPLVIWGEAPWEYSPSLSSKDLQELEKDIFDNLAGLGLTADEILASQQSGQLDERDIRPFLFPSTEEIKRIGLRGIYLGNYIPWNSRKHAEIIKKELG